MYISHVENQSKGTDLKKYEASKAASYRIWKLVQMSEKRILTWNVKSFKEKVQEHVYFMRPELKFKRRNIVSPQVFPNMLEIIKRFRVMRFSSLYMDTLRKKSYMTILLISTNKKETFSNIQAITMEY